MENKNTIVAVVLMLAVWLGFTLFFPPQQQDPAGNEVPASGGQDQGAGGTGEPASDRESGAIRLTESGPAVVNDELVATERQIVVDTVDFRAVFSSLGGRLQKVVLKDYRISAEDDSASVALLAGLASPEGTLGLRGTGGLGLSPALPYQVEGPERLELQAGQEEDLVFRAMTPSGVQVEKRFALKGSGFAIGLEVRVTNPGTAPVHGSLVLEMVNAVPEEDEGQRFTHVGPVTLLGDEKENTAIEDLVEGPRVFGGETVWSGFENKYFLSAAVPLEDAARSVRIQLGDNRVVTAFETPDMSLPAGGDSVFRYLTYFGPRDLDILKGVDHQLAAAIDFGFFSFLARPLLHALKFFYSFIGNYGVAIILITVIIKLLFWPLTQKSYSSMKGMQKLQPEMQKIREKYKDDKERLNKEMMELYRTHRVNPLGGCLPMLIQIPVFFALYRVLMESIELRHAEFVFWLTDLSAKDPYYITPLIMGATMFLQQKMTPTTMDPNQAKIFMFMPVIFTFLFLNFPSGLVLYWLVNNLLTILQQYFINRKPA